MDHESHESVLPPYPKPLTLIFINILPLTTVLLDFLTLHKISLVLAVALATYKWRKTPLTQYGNLAEVLELSSIKLKQIKSLHTQT